MFYSVSILTIGEVNKTKPVFFCVVLLKIPISHNLSGAHFFFQNKSYCEQNLVSYIPNTDKSPTKCCWLFVSLFSLTLDDQDMLPWSSAAPPTLNKCESRGGSTLAPSSDLWHAELRFRLISSNYSYTNPRVHQRKSGGRVGGSFQLLVLTQRI